MIKENWKAIKNYEGYYEAGDLGHIKSLSRIVNHGNFNVLLRERILKPDICGSFSKYECVTLYKDGEHKKCLVHILIYETFKGVIDDGLTVDHIDNNSLNNRLNNLVVVTRKENNNKALNNKTPSGYTKCSYKLINAMTNEEQIYRTSGEISNLLELSTTHVRNCAMKKGTTKLLCGIYKIEPIAYIPKMN